MSDDWAKELREANSRMSPLSSEVPTLAEAGRLLDEAMSERDRWRATARNYKTTYEQVSGERDVYQKALEYLASRPEDIGQADMIAWAALKRAGGPNG